MKKLFSLLAVGTLAVCAHTQTHPVHRPRITGIDHVSFYTTQPEEVKKFTAARSAWHPPRRWSLAGC
jgi:hypothetical protein